MVEVKVMGIAVDNNSHMPVVILKDESSNKILPIWIGIFEAQAILLALEGVSTPRPFTHDLLKNAIEQLGGQVERIVVHSIYENTYFARIEVKVDSKVLELDARPSDSIALALRCNAPVYVTEPIINATNMPLEPITDEEVNRFKEYLKKLKPEDLI
jgi:bifunctional DNase/RNase